jgi:hypothetical protein
MKNGFDVFAGSAKSKVNHPVLISIVWLGIRPAACLSSAKAVRALLHAFRTARVSKSVPGGNGGRPLWGFVSTRTHDKSMLTTCPHNMSLYLFFSDTFVTNEGGLLLSRQL